MPSLLRFGLAGAGAWAALSVAPAAAQAVGGGWDERLRIEGTQAGALFGSAVDDAGDVDADGVRDFIVGAPSADVAGFQGAGAAYVYSGATGLRLWSFDGPHDFACFGTSVSGAGDVDGDGHADLLIGAPCADVSTGVNEGAAFLYSGASGQMLQQLVGLNNVDGFGDAVDGGGDVDGDGTPDLLIGAPYTDPRGATCGTAYVYSGAALLPGAPLLLLQVDGYHNTELGDSLAFIGDLDLDARDDFILGLPGAQVNGVMNSGSAVVISGGNGSVLFRLDNPIRGLLGRGSSVSGAGDVNGDGLPDFALGAPFAEPNGWNVAGAIGAASGRSGLGLWSKIGVADATLGWSVSGAGDLDGDGLPDLVASALGRGAVVMLRGFDGTPIWRLAVEADGGDQGAVAGLGDLDGDGFPEILVGSGGSDPQGVTDAGAVYLFEHREFLSIAPHTLSAAAGGTVQVNVDFPASAAGQPYQVLASRSGTGPVWIGGVLVPLTSDGVLFRTRTGRYPPYSSAFAGQLDAAGDAKAVLAPGPNQFPAVLIGSTVHFAAVTGASPGVWSLSTMAAALQVVP